MAQKGNLGGLVAEENHPRHVTQELHHVTVTQELHLPSWARRRTAQVPPNTHRLAECQGCITGVDKPHVCGTVNDVSSSNQDQVAPHLNMTNTTPSLSTIETTGNSIIHYPPQQVPDGNHINGEVLDSAAVSKVHTITSLYPHPSAWHQDHHDQYGPYGGAPYNFYLDNVIRRPEHLSYYVPSADRPFYPGYDRQVCNGNFQYELPSSRVLPSGDSFVHQTVHSLPQAYAYPPHPENYAPSEQHREGFSQNTTHAASRRQVYYAPSPSQQQQMLPRPYSIAGGYYPYPNLIGHGAGMSLDTSQVHSSSAGAGRVSADVIKDSHAHNGEASQQQTMGQDAPYDSSVGKSIASFSASRFSANGLIQEFAGDLQNREQTTDKEERRKTSLNEKYAETKPGVDFRNTTGQDDTPLSSFLDNLRSPRNNTGHSVSEINNNAGTGTMILENITAPITQHLSEGETRQPDRFLNHSKYDDLIQPNISVVSTANQKWKDLEKLRTERTSGQEDSNPVAVVEVIPSPTAFVIDLSGSTDDVQKVGMSLGDCAQKHLMRRSTSRNKRLIVTSDLDEDKKTMLKEVVNSPVTGVVRPRTSMEYSSFPLSSFSPRFVRRTSTLTPEPSNKSPSLRVKSRSKTESQSSVDGVKNQIPMPRTVSQTSNSFSPATTEHVSLSQSLTFDMYKQIPNPQQTPITQQASAEEREPRTSGVLNRHYRTKDVTEKKSELSDKQELREKQTLRDRQTLSEVRAQMLSRSAVTANKEQSPRNPRRWSQISNEPSPPAKQSIVESLKALRKMKKASKEKFNITTESDTSGSDGGLSDAETYTVHDERVVREARDNIERTFGVGLAQEGVIKGDTHENEIELFIDETVIQRNIEESSRISSLKNSISSLKESSTNSLDDITLMDEVKQSQKSPIFKHADDIAYNVPESTLQKKEGSTTDANTLGRSPTFDAKKSKRMLPVVPARSNTDSPDIHALLRMSKDKSNEAFDSERIELYVDEPQSRTVITGMRGHNKEDDKSLDDSIQVRHQKSNTRARRSTCDNNGSVRHGSETIDGTTSIVKKGKFNPNEVEVELIVNINGKSGVASQQQQQHPVDAVRFKKKPGTTIPGGIEIPAVHGNVTKSFNSGSTGSGRPTANGHKDASHGPTLRCRSKTPSITSGNTKTGGRGSVPLVAPANKDGSVSSIDRLSTPRSRSRPSAELELKVYSSTPASGQCSVKSVPTPLKSNVAQHGRYIKCDAPIGRSQYGTPVVPVTTTKTGLPDGGDARHRSISRSRLKPQISTASSEEASKDRGRQSIRPSTAATTQVSVSSVSSSNSGRSTLRSRSTGILRIAGAPPDAPRAVPTCSTPTLVTLQDSFKKRMTYKPQESVAKSKELKKQTDGMRIRSSTDESVDDVTSLDDPSDISTTSGRSLRDRTFDGDDGFSDVTESVITSMSTSVSCDLSDLTARAAREAAAHEMSYDCVLVSSICKLSHDVKRMTGQLYQRLSSRLNVPNDSILSPCNSTALFSFDDKPKLEDALCNLKESMRRLEVSMPFCPQKRAAKHSDV